jgi:tetratricopeptide (TPR) repeat protein
MNDNWQPDTPSENPSRAPDPQAMNEFAQAIKSWADATTAGDSEAAQLAALQAFTLASEKALRNPPPDFLLKQEADDLESQGKWSEAEAVRQKVVVLSERTGNFGLLARAQMDLCRLLRLVGRVQDASHWAGAAITSARRAELFPLVVMALGYEVSCALDRGDTPGALAAASEALQLIEPGKMYDQMRAKALTTRAKCLLANSDPTGAALDLAASWELLKARSGSWMMTMPGPVGAMANWWEVKCQLEERQGNLANAKAAMAEAIIYRRQAEGSHARLALARALEKLGEISQAVGDVADGEKARSEAQTIRLDLQLPGSRSGQ